MGIARSTYYEPALAPTDDTAIVDAIAAICDEFESYGWRRVRAALRQQGLIVNHKKIKRLMREHGLHRRSAGDMSRRPTVITTSRSFPIWQRTWSSTVPTSCGSPRSLMSRSPSASSMSP
jgi:hypothetical protein